MPPLPPDPWIIDNPRLAHDGGLALDSARVAATDAMYAALGLPPVDDEDDEDEGEGEYSSEHRRAHRIAMAVFDAILDSLGTDTALAARGSLPAVTVAELHQAYLHDL